jgi:branched-chain amino acid transport system permease protein
VANPLKSKKSDKKTKVAAAFNQAKWVRGFTITAVLVWIFYAFIFNNLPEPLFSFFQSWFPASSINESLVWVICALGLNIVVGYAGLLDLGFVAFWAIGGYVAGWLMSLRVSTSVFG